jgi:hypothetical protein
MNNEYEVLVIFEPTYEHAHVIHVCVCTDMRTFQYMYV